MCSTCVSPCLELFCLCVRRLSLCHETHVISLAALYLAYVVLVSVITLMTLCHDLSCSVSCLQVRLKWTNALLNDDSTVVASPQEGGGIHGGGLHEALRCLQVMQSCLWGPGSPRMQAIPQSCLPHSASPNMIGGATFPAKEF